MPQSIVAQVFAEEWPRLVATLVQDLRDIDAAEDAAQQAFTEAAEKWGPGTTPDKPGAWLLTAARRRSIDRLRRETAFADRMAQLKEKLETPPAPRNQLIDDQLALIFGCCHPSLDAKAQVALTLRTVCGLSTSQIASSFFVAEPAMAKRLVRAKSKIRAANIPFETPSRELLTERLPSVLAVIYLIYTEGHAASDGQVLVRGSLCDEARWLADLVADLLPNESEASGLAALISLTDARRAGRTDESGEVVLLEQQDRSRWDSSLVDAGRWRLAQARKSDSIGPYEIQAWIALEHSGAASHEATNWQRIASFYDVLHQLEPTDVVALNRAVALSKANGPQAGLDALTTIEGLGEYRYYHAAMAEFLTQLGQRDQAKSALEAALGLTTNETERVFFQTQIETLSKPGADETIRPD